MSANLSGSPEELLSLTAAAERLGINFRVQRTAIHSGDLPAYRVGGKRYRLLWADVTAWVFAQRVASEGARRDARGDAGGV